MIGVAIYNDGNCKIEDVIKVKKTFAGEEMQLFGHNGVYFIGVDYCTWVTLDDVEVELSDFCLRNSEQCVTYKVGVINGFV
ncbi:MAG: hypothetical protein ACRCZ2_06790 [Fusobacteriaceae bacterium]